MADKNFRLLTADIALQVSQKENVSTLAKDIKKISDSINRLEGTNIKLQELANGLDALSQSKNTQVFKDMAAGVDSLKASFKEMDSSKMKELIQILNKAQKNVTFSFDLNFEHGLKELERRITNMLERRIFEIQYVGKDVGSKRAKTKDSLATKGGLLSLGAGIDTLNEQLRPVLDKHLKAAQKVGVSWKTVSDIFDELKQDYNLQNASLEQQKRLLKQIITLAKSNPEFKKQFDVGGVKTSLAQEFAKLGPAVPGELLSDREKAFKMMIVQAENFVNLSDEEFDKYKESMLNVFREIFAKLIFNSIIPEGFDAITEETKEFSREQDNIFGRMGVGVKKKFEDMYDINMAKILKNAGIEEELEKAGANAGNIEDVLREWGKISESDAKFIGRLYAKGLISIPEETVHITQQTEHIWEETGKKQVRIIEKMNDRIISDTGEMMMRIDQEYQKLGGILDQSKSKTTTEYADKWSEMVAGIQNTMSKLQDSSFVEGLKKIAEVTAKELKSTLQFWIYLGAAIVIEVKKLFDKLIYNSIIPDGYSAIIKVTTKFILHMTRVFGDFKEKAIKTFKEVWSGITAGYSSGMGKEVQLIDPTKTEQSFNEIGRNIADFDKKMGYYLNSIVKEEMPVYDKALDQMIIATGIALKKMVKLWWWFASILPKTVLWAMDKIIFNSILEDGLVAMWKATQQYLGKMVNVFKTMGGQVVKSTTEFVDKSKKAASGLKDAIGSQVSGAYSAAMQKEPLKTVAEQTEKWVKELSDQYATLTTKREVLNENFANLPSKSKMLEDEILEITKDRVERSGQLWDQLSADAKAFQINLTETSDKVGKQLAQRQENVEEYTRRVKAAFTSELSPLDEFKERWERTWSGVGLAIQGAGIGEKLAGVREALYGFGPATGKVGTYLDKLIGKYLETSEAQNKLVQNAEKISRKYRDFTDTLNSQFVNLKRLAVSEFGDQGSINSEISSVESTTQQVRREWQKLYNTIQSGGKISSGQMAQLRNETDLLRGRMDRLIKAGIIPAGTASAEMLKGMSAGISESERAVINLTARHNTFVKQVERAKNATALFDRIKAAIGGVISALGGVISKLNIFGKGENDVRRINSAVRNVTVTVNGLNTAWAAVITGFSSAAGYAGFNLLISKIKEMKADVSEVTQLLLDMNDGAIKVAAATGEGEAGIEKYYQTIKKIYRNNFGDSIEEIEQALKQAMPTLNRFGIENEEQVQNIIENMFRLSDAYGADFTETMDAASALVQNMGMPFEDAFDFITKGFQRGLNKSNDFLDSIREYSVVAAQAELTQAQWFSLMDTGLQSGVLGTDKINDAFKEFQIRLLDNSDTTKQAFKDMGLNYESTIKKVNEGSLSIAQVFQTVLGKLGDMDLAARSAVGPQIVGTQFEDMSEKAIRAVDLASTKQEELTGSVKGLDLQYDTLTDRMQELRRAFLLAFDVEPLKDLQLRVVGFLEYLFATRVDGFIQRIVSNISNFANNIITVFDYLNSGVGTIQGFFGNFIAGIFSAIRADFPAAFEFLKVAFFEGINYMFVEIDSFLSDANNWGYNFIAELSNGIINGASSLLQSAVNMVGEMISSFLEPGSPPEQGPLSTIDKWGAPLMELFLNGWTKVDSSSFASILDPLREEFNALGKSDEFQAAEGILNDLIQTYNESGELDSSKFMSLQGILGDEAAMGIKREFTGAKASGPLGEIQGLQSVATVAKETSKSRAKAASSASAAISKAMGKEVETAQARYEKELEEAKAMYDANLISREEYLRKVEAAELNWWQSEENLDKEATARKIQGIRDELAELEAAKKREAELERAAGKQTDQQKLDDEMRKLELRKEAGEFANNEIDYYKELIRLQEKQIDINAAENDTEALKTNVDLLNEYKTKYEELKEAQKQKGPSEGADITPVEPGALREEVKSAGDEVGGIFMQAIGDRIDKEAAALNQKTVDTFAKIRDSVLQNFIGPDTTEVEEGAQTFVQRFTDSLKAKITAPILLGAGVGVPAAVAFGNSLAGPASKEFGKEFAKKAGPALQTSWQVSKIVLPDWVVTALSSAGTMILRVAGSLKEMATTVRIAFSSWELFVSGLTQVGAKLLPIGRLVGKATLWWLAFEAVIYGVQSNTENLARIFDDAWANISPILDRFVTGFLVIWNILFGEGGEDTPLGIAIDFIAYVLGKLWNIVEGVLPNVQKFFEGTFETIYNVLKVTLFPALHFLSGFFSLLTGDSEEFGNAMDMAWQAIVDGLPGITAGLVDIGASLISLLPSVLGSLLAFLPDLFGNEEAAQGIRNFFNGLLDLIPGAAEPFIQFFKDILANGISLQSIFEAAGQGDLGTFLQQQFDQAWGKLTEAWGRFKEIISKAWIDIEPTLINIGDIFGKIKDSVVEAFSTLWSTLRPYLQPLIDWWNQDGVELWWLLEGVVKVVAGSLVVIILGIVATIVSLITGIAAFIDTLVNGFYSIYNGVTTLFAGFGTLWEGFVLLITGLFSGDSAQIAAAWDLMWQGLTDIVDGLWLTIVGIFEVSFGAIYELLETFVSTFIQFFVDLYDELVGNSIVPDIVNDILELFEDTDWLEIGANIVDGIKKGISDNAEKLITYVKSLAGRILDTVADLLGIKSPSTEFFNIGSFIVQGLAAGIQANLGLLQNSAQYMYNAVTGEFLSPIKTAVSAQVDIGNALAEVREQMEKVGNLTLQQFHARGASKEVRGPIADYLMELRDFAKEGGIHNWGNEKTGIANLDQYGAMIIENLEKDIAAGILDPNNLPGLVGGRSSWLGELFAEKGIWSKGFDLNPNEEGELKEDDRRYVRERWNPNVFGRFIDNYFKDRLELQRDTAGEYLGVGQSIIDLQKDIVQQYSALTEQDEARAAQARDYVAGILGRQFLGADIFQLNAEDFTGELKQAIIQAQTFQAQKEISAADEASLWQQLEGFGDVYKNFAQVQGDYDLFVAQLDYQNSLIEGNLSGNEKLEDILNELNDTLKNLNFNFNTAQSGALRTTEGLWYLHDNEMVLDPQTAQGMRALLTGNKNYGMITSRPNTNATAGNKNVNVTFNTTINGEMDRRVFETRVLETVRRAL